MKINKKLLLTILVLNVSFIVQAFSSIIIDINNPYSGIFVHYNSSDLGENKLTWEAHLHGNFYENYGYIRSSLNPIGKDPESMFFQIVINDGKDFIRLKEHNFNITNRAFFHEEVLKEEFSLNEKQGEIIYKVIVKAENATWSNSSVLFDFCKVKILYAELDGKEMKLNKDTWKAIQKNCTIKESLKQNCVRRDSYYEDETSIDKQFERIEADMATNDAQIEAADQTHDLFERRRVRLDVIDKSAYAAAYTERYIQLINTAHDRAKIYRDYQRHVEQQLPAIEADIFEKYQKMEEEDSRFN